MKLPEVEKIDESRELEAIAKIIKNSDISDDIECMDMDELAETLENDEDLYILLRTEKELSIIF